MAKTRQKTGEMNFFSQIESAESGQKKGRKTRKATKAEQAAKGKTSTTSSKVAEQVKAEPKAAKPAEVQAAAVVCDDPIAARFDPRSMTSREMSLMAQQLYQAGRIDRQMLAMLSFQPEMNANYDRVGAEGIERPDPDQPRDTLAEWEKILDTQMGFDSSVFFTNKTRDVIALLKSLEKARKGE